MGNFTNPVNITSTVGIGTYLNTVTGGWWWSVMLIVIFIIAFVSLKYFFSKADSLAASSFVCLLLGFMLRAAELIEDKVLYLFGILLMIGLSMMWQSSPYGSP